MIHDPALFKLGRKAVRHDDRTLCLAKYLDPTALPTPPSAIDYGGKVTNWEMLGNNSLGDCTIAALLHAIMLWNSQEGIEISFTDAIAISLYSQLCGYVPGDPSTDNGGVELDILNTWRKSNLGGCTLLGYVSVDPTNWEHVKIAHWLSGTLYMGLSLPVSAQDEDEWSDTSGEPGTWGGHAVISCAYSDLVSQKLTCVTWGQEKVMTQEWLARYCDELYAPITAAWFDKSGKAPNGFNVDQLQADLAALTGGA